MKTTSVTHFKMSEMLFGSNKNVTVLSFHYIYGRHRTGIISVIIT